MYLVYKHTSPSGKAYIGITNDYDRRCVEHQSKTNGCRRFAKAIKKYGWDSFLHEELANNLTLAQANELETCFILEHGTLSPYGYNLTTGGDVTILCSETIQRMAQAKRGRKTGPHSVSHKAKISSSLLGRPMSEERKLKNCKSYIVTSPSGDEYCVTNLHQFSKDFGLVGSCLTKVARGVLRQYKGWLCYYSDSSSSSTRYS